MKTTNVIFLTNKRIFCKCALRMERVLLKGDLKGEVLCHAAATRQSAPELGISNVNMQADSFSIRHGWEAEDVIGFYAVRSSFAVRSP